MNGMRSELELPRTDSCDSDRADVSSMRPPGVCSDEELLVEVRECEAVVRRALAKQYALMAEIERRGLLAGP